MNNNIGLRIVSALVLDAALAGIAFFAYSILFSGRLAQRIANLHPLLLC